MSIEKFKSDANDALAKFHGLELIENTGNPFLAGNLDILDGEGTFWHSYSVEIHYNTRYPSAFPTVFETGGSIRRIADWHINNDGSCCLDNEFSQQIKCCKGINLESFISAELIPWLANQSFRRLTGRYANGEQSHGDIGRREFFIHELQAPNFSTWGTGRRERAREKSYPRQSRCFCGSQKKWRHCHKQIFEKLKPIKGAALNWAIQKFTKYVNSGYGFLLALQQHAAANII